MTRCIYQPNAIGEISPEVATVNRVRHNDRVSWKAPGFVVVRDSEGKQPRVIAVTPAEQLELCAAR